MSYRQLRICVRTYVCPWPYMECTMGELMGLSSNGGKAKIPRCHSPLRRPPWSLSVWVQAIRHDAKWWATSSRVSWVQQSWGHMLDCHGYWSIFWTERRFFYCLLGRKARRAVCIHRLLSWIFCSMIIISMFNNDSLIVRHGFLRHCHLAALI